MRILYAIQGTGNGHLARALDVYPALCAYGEVDVLVSGIQADLSLPFPVKYKHHGLSFIFGKKGGINKWATFRSMRLWRLLRDIFSLPVAEYDLVINDFEPVSAWACKLHRKPFIGLSHQSAAVNERSPKPAVSDWFGRWILKNYASAPLDFGFHFKAYTQQMFTPVVRRSVRQLTRSDAGHYTVYLPSYDDHSLIKELSVFPAIQWDVFSKHCKEAFVFKNIKVQPLNNYAFTNSMAASSGVLCGAGFETPAEALFLGKKLMVVPMSGQYEQQCNAACLEEMGVPVISRLCKSNRNALAAWLDSSDRVVVHYPDNVEAVVEQLMETAWSFSTSSIRFA